MSYSKALIPPRAPPPEAMTRMRPARMTGYIVVTLWALLGVALLAMMITNWDNEKFFKYGPRFVHGLITTLELVAFSIVFGAVLSVPLAFARMSKNRLFSGFAYVYVYVFRGTPILAQLFLIYYGLGSFRPEWQSVGLWWFFREAWYCGLLSLTLNTAAYQTEILRGAIISVSKGQHEAASSLGIPKLVAFFKIILPQALIVALRPYGNEIILMVKGSAVVAIITVFDLMGETRYAFSQTYDYQSYLWAAIFYLSIVEILRHFLEWTERRLTRHLVR
ncbi:MULTISPECIES: ABC transporter permease [Rhizobium]|uniref:ABC transporter permease n=1 Tax=Rhizobium rhododendri TaxID=2506430 RepID=A0ABY8ILI1_9HYPH|nr:MULTISPECIES: ABC transporter permease [Rhizobium]MBO9098637.1 ABC transporter permease [Rhizobium sp. L58/93]MBO9132558.1 ABC transporter permease [Rhizobium sp. B209b/85]MBO9168903.1 ABC transporter permease [Rhizobium sp. L245/93]MBO9184853.1 ABC transporter permease [Rhizobium sp. E27B/91]MBZ5758267.1 ABC transporter permease [Rhizobium sp. VS19-DR96]